MTTAEEGKMHFVDKDADREESEMETYYTRIQTLDAETLLRYVSWLEHKWWLTRDRADIHFACRLGYEQFFDGAELSPAGFPKHAVITTVDEKRSREIRILKSVGARIKALDMAEYRLPDDDLEVGERHSRLMKQVNDAFKNVRLHVMHAQRITQPRESPLKFDIDPEYFDGTPMPMLESSLKEMSPYQRAIVGCLSKLYEKGMRRYKDNVCVQRMSEGKPTRAWMPVYTIQEFVYHCASKEDNYEMWKDLTSKGSGFKDVINHLSNCVDHQFPEIQKNRHVFAFKNGLFNAKEWLPNKGVYGCRFYPYESREYMALDPTIVAAKFFDQYFEEYNVLDWYTDVPTPHMQNIMDYQGFDQDACKWLYCMGGRLVFDVNDLDSWQIIPYLKGVARSGKSTLITKIFRKFYDSEDVRTLSNNIERKFGLSSIANGFMFISPEISGELQLEQTEFQSLVSGEDVSCAVKNKAPMNMTWKTPGILAGNEVPGYRDNSGSILRRLLTWSFGKTVKDDVVDPHLDQKLHDELPAILYKCVLAYIDFSQKYSGKDIWNVTPPYFKRVQKQVAMNVSSLTNYLEQPEVVYGKDLCVPQKVLVMQYKNHCTLNNLGNPKFNPDAYAGAFNARDLTVQNMTMVWQGNHYKNEPFIYGLTLDLQN